MGTDGRKTPGSKIDELDSFWDLSDIMPKHRKASVPAHDTEPVTVFVGDDSAESAEEKIRRRTDAGVDCWRENGRRALGNADEATAVRRMTQEKSEAVLPIPGCTCPEPGGNSAGSSGRTGADSSASGIEPQQQNARLMAAKRALAAAERKYLKDTRAFGDPLRGSGEPRNKKQGIDSCPTGSKVDTLPASGSRPESEAGEDRELRRETKIRTAAAHAPSARLELSSGTFAGSGDACASCHAPNGNSEDISDATRLRMQDAAGSPSETDPTVPLAEYTPERNPMLNRVSVYRWPARYTFYGRFRGEALSMLWENGKPVPCAYVPFFSFMPLPHQLGEQQRTYYLFWRDELMQDRPLRTDFSYILLLIYEIINLPDCILPEQGIHLLCFMWKAYRKDFPKLDRYLTEWVCDYCLIHNVMPEMTLICGFYPEILDIAVFKEFYIGCGAKEGADPYAEAVFAYASDYNWHSSKFLTQENKKLFEMHMRGAFMAAFERFCREEARASGTWASASRKSLHASLTRDSYSGALCAYDRKCRIVVVYKSCMRTPELRFFVTGLIKYSENQIRGLLGIKSRFHVQQLDPRMKEAVDHYFEPYRRRASAKRQEPSEPPAYEKQYDAIDHGFDAEKAKQIEVLAWNTTGKLTSAFSDEPDAAETEGSFTGMMTDGCLMQRTAELFSADAVKTNGIVPEDRLYGKRGTASDQFLSGNKTATPESSGALPKDVSGPASGELSAEGKFGGDKDSSGNGVSPSEGDVVLKKAFGLLLEGQPRAFSALAGQLNLMPETLAERLNELAYDILGDIAVEADENGGFRLLPDYREEIEAWMNQ